MQPRFLLQPSPSEAQPPAAAAAAHPAAAAAHPAATHAFPPAAQALSPASQALPAAPQAFTAAPQPPKPITTTTAALSATPKPTPATAQPAPAQALAADAALSASPATPQPTTHHRLPPGEQCTRAVATQRARHAKHATGCGACLARACHASPESAQMHVVWTSCPLGTEHRAPPQTTIQPSHAPFLLLTAITCTSTASQCPL